ncbi:TetR/AcrR family transcriptional regulator [Metabacillus sp. GX 13764]|nr:TetR/AcrR family transcriptional regulator [Metabacillus kandeliae]MCD7034093.1 TetR/AcrR family transcriptional regulator [Metabacillus kandeliae]
MSPLNEEQLKQKRDERREQILAAALKVFARRGLIGTKMSMISEEAGISQGLMYRYFESKNELFTTLVQQAMNESVSGIQEVEKMSGTPLQKLKFLTEMILEEDGQAYFMLIHHARTSDEVPPETKKLFEDYSMDAYIVLLEPLIKEGQRIGELAQDDYREMISNYFLVISGLMTLGIHNFEGFQMPRADVLLRMFTKER